MNIIWNKYLGMGKYIVVIKHPERELYKIGIQDDNGYEDKLNKKDFYELPQVLDILVDLVNISKQTVYRLS